MRNILKILIEKAETSQFIQAHKHTKRTRVTLTDAATVWATIGLPSPSTAMDGATRQIVDVVQANWGQIRCFELLGLGRNNILDIINCNTHLNGVVNLEDITDQLVSYYITQKRLVKLSCAPGFIYETPDGLNYFRPSPNNGALIPHPILIRSIPHLIKTIKSMMKNVSNEKIQMNAPSNSECKTIGLVQLQFYFYKTPFFSLGSPTKLPRSIIAMESLHNLTHRKRNVPYKDKKCLFRCIAISRQSDQKHPNWARVEIESEKACARYCKKMGVDISDFSGVPETELYNIEMLFNSSITIYRLSSNKRPIPCYTTKNPYARYNLHLLQVNDHLCHIHDLESFVGTHVCTHCNTAFGSKRDINQHQQKHCPVLTKKKLRSLPNFGGTFKKKEHLTDIFERHGIKCDNDQNNTFVVYDFESRQVQASENNTEKTSMSTEHIVASVFLACNLHGDSEDKLLTSYFVAADDTRESSVRVIRQFYKQLLYYCKEMRRVLDAKYDKFYDEVQQRINEQNSEMDMWLCKYPDRKKSRRRPGQHDSLSPLEKALVEFRKEFSVLKVISFNGKDYR